MNEERFYEIFEIEDFSMNMMKGDNAWQGLQIIAKYIDPLKNDIICGADHDVIYSVGVNEIIDAGITEDDAIELRNLNWMAPDGYLACFV